MLRLRPYKISDAKYMINWIKDEKTFAKWCANLIPYPLTEEVLHEYRNKYEDDTEKFLFTAINEIGTPLGHFLMKMVDNEERVHLCFVIVDSSKRNKGYGKEMLKLAITYAFKILKVSKVTLSVFDNNPIAYNCYKALGFIEEPGKEKEFLYKDEAWNTYYMSLSAK
ncbi:GNAT family N-acetyltransferase [Clostridium cellulovorans]|uniref:GCN5-related N-acetyltransferase n=1 Tax=Clostridium cellulovorans (strain ATCC 35296 / DSM 3052 / OCM 3 / 743B) TaxID=573061 RepID=D9SQR4_CLOC7|nr:GNAT family protein [Clostridium cellulovorans]ADL52270.1 GCN5-related N-acetyltransferase [Clostridium cellulovorans 743B]